MSFIKRSLFGGAITCEIPADWRDVSDVRQVPDHQECWQEMNGSVLVVEILEHQAGADAKFFFDDLAEANGAGASCPFRVDKELSRESLVSGVGFQKVNNTTVRSVGETNVKIELAVLRLPQVGTDILITISTPNKDKKDDSIGPVFRHAIRTFQVEDWSLFG